MKKSLYDLVGVPPEAPREMIASACRRRIAKLERESGDEARAQVYAIREAWSILGDDKLRAGYDASLAPAGPATAGSAPRLAEIAPVNVADALLRPRRLLPGNWDRYRKLVFVMFFVGLFALSAIWNQSRRVAVQKRVEAAEYEAEHGGPPPAPKAGEAKPAAAEPFSAEKFEREMKEREAELKDQVAREQTAKEDEFREKNQRDNSTGSRGRRSRYR